MKRRLIAVALVLFWMPLMAQAATYDIYPKVAISIPDLPAVWKVTDKAPMDLVEHIAEHIQEEMAHAGKKLSDEQALKMAKKRLEAEELFLFNPKTEAHVTISIDAMGADEKAPTQADVKLSANYAASGVGEEGWENLKVRYISQKVPGADVAQRFEIDFTHEGEKGQFVGLVGFSNPFWFWVYATDHGGNPADKQTINAIVDGFKVIRK